jgi:glycosyltransferase involved in cell wall biosynthesis
MARLLQDLLTLDQVKSLRYHTLSTQKHPFVQGSFPVHSKLSVQEHLIDTKVTFIGAFSCLIKQESYNLKRFENEQICQLIAAELQQTTYDFVIFESLFAAVYARSLRPYSAAKFIYRSHNIEHQIWKDLANNTKHRLKKWYLQQLAYTLKWAERSIWSEDHGGLDLILAISNSDLIVMESQTLSTCRYLPASLARAKQQSSLSPQKLCFLGAFNWQPNVEAVNWFLSQIYPALLQRFPKLEFHIAGKGAELQKHWKQQGVVIHGFVPNSSEFIAEHGIFVGCLQSGSGVKMKIIEAMSVGAPIVMSEKSTDGLPDWPSELTLSSDQAFFNELEFLLQNPEAMQARSLFCSSYFERHFESKHVQRQLLQILEELQNNR